MFRQDAADKVVAAIHPGGLAVTTAVRVGGISRATHYRWLRSNPEYRAAVEHAEGMRSGQLEMNIRTQGAGDWRSHAWLLERTDPNFREKRELAVHVERAVEELLTALQGEVSESAFAEVVDAVARLQGLDEEEPAADPGPGGATAALPAPGRGGS